MSQAAGPSRLSDESRPVSPIAAVRAANFFEPLPAGAGGYILSRVVHDWDDDVPHPSELCGCGTT
jgi:hypothetical protein